MIKKVWLATLFLLCIATGLYAGEKRADLVIYSFDRPTQLFAFLESADYYMTGLGEVIVIYRSSDDDFSQAYQEVADWFPGVVFFKQGSNPRSDFKPLTLRATFDSPHDYILFAVDDIIVKDFIDVQQSIEWMEQYGAYAFFFKMGLHLTRCYTQNRSQPVPPHIRLEEDLYSWTFKDGTSDWNYPYSVDMVLYRKNEIEPHLRSLRYNNPNSFEGAWSCFGGRVAQKTGLFHAVSKVVNLPINKVQLVNNNRSMDAYSPRELLDVFNQNLKIDFAPLYRVKNNAVHMEYVPTFVPRNKE